MSEKFSLDSSDINSIIISISVTAVSIHLLNIHLHSKQFIDIYFQTPCNVHQVFKVWLSRVCTPLGNGCRIFAQPFSKPLIRAILLRKNNFYSIQVFSFHILYFINMGTKIKNSWQKASPITIKYSYLQQKICFIINFIITAI